MPVGNIAEFRSDRTPISGVAARNRIPVFEADQIAPVDPLVACNASRSSRWSE
jgi:hypothetical protein